MVQRRDKSDIGMVALNGTLLGGTLMVKDEELFAVLKENAGKLEEVLQAVGITAGQGNDDLREEDLDDSRFQELSTERHSASAL